MASKDTHTQTVIVLDANGNVVNFTSSGGTSMTDDAAFTAGTTPIVPMGAVYQATPDSIDDGDGGAVRMSIDRILMVGGNLAHDAVDSGNPVKIGGKANSAVPTAVSAADRVDGWFGLNGQTVISAGISNTNHTGTNALGMIDTSGTPRPVAIGMYNGSNYDSIRGDTTNGLDVDVTRIAGVVSTNNSTTSVLGAGAAFTGTADTITNYASIMVNVIASHASATDGLSLQQSSNGTNWDIIDTYTIAANTPKVFTLNPAATNFRVVYTNGGTLQTSFRLQVVYKYTAATESSQRAADAYTNETDLTQSQGFLMGYNGTTWDRLRSVNTGMLQVAPTFAGTVASTGTGASGAQTQRVVTSTDSTIGTVTTVTTLTGTTTLTPGTGASNLGKAEDAAHTTGDVGVMALGVRAASPTERSAGPTDGDYEPFATNEVGAVWTSLTPSVNGGLSTFMASGSDGSSILVATAQVVKASAGALYGYYAYNPEAAVTFVHFYNTAAASVTVGTTNPLFSFAIPAGSAANLTFPMGVTFSNAGWSVAATTTAGGNTAPATGVSLVAWYK